MSLTQRTARPPAPAHPRAPQPCGRLGLIISILLSLAAALVIIPLALVYIGLLRDLPSLETLPQYLDPPNGWLLQPTRLYDQTVSTSFSAWRILPLPAEVSLCRR